MILNGTGKQTTGAIISGLLKRGETPTPYTQATYTLTSATDLPPAAFAFAIPQTDSPIPQNSCGTAIVAIHPIPLSVKATTKANQLKPPAHEKEKEKGRPTHKQ